MSLRGAALDSPGESAVVLLREWFGLEVVPSDGFDERGVHWLLRAMGGVASELPRSLRWSFERTGEIDEDGMVIVVRDGPIWKTRPGPPESVVVSEHEIRGREVAAEPLEQCVLNHLLHGMRIEAPVAAEGQFIDMETAEDCLRSYGALGHWRNTAVDRVVFQFYAADEAILQYLPPHRLLVFGLTRAGVESVWEGQEGPWTWSALDRLYGPEDDIVLGGTYQQFKTEESARSGEDLISVLSVENRTEATRRFLRSWYGLELPDPGEVAGPPLLRALQRLNVRKKIIGAHNNLLQPDEERIDDDGLTWFYGENQFVWQAAYEGTSDDSPVWWDQFENGSSEQSLRESGYPLDEFLFTELLSEALTGAPYSAIRTQGSRDGVADIFDQFTLALELPDGKWGFWTDGRMLIGASLLGWTTTLRAGAHERAHIADSPLRDLGGWHWFYERLDRRSEHDRLRDLAYVEPRLADDADLEARLKLLDDPFRREHPPTEAEKQAAHDALKKWFGTD